MADTDTRFESNVENVTAATPEIGGAIRVAPYGTDIPTDATAELASAFKTLGYISEDGFVNTNGMETSEVRAWGGDTVLTGETNKPDKFKTKLIEYLNVDVLKFIYGDDNVEVNEDGTVKAVHANSVEHKPVVLVVEEILKNDKKARTICANATLTELGDITHKQGETIGFDCTVTAKPDNAHKNKNGVPDTHVTYFA